MDTTPPAASSRLPETPPPHFAEPDSRTRPTETGRSNGTTGTIATAAATLLVLYILSTGPVVAFYESNPGYMGTWHALALRSFYKPLIYLSDNCVPVRDFFLSYSNLCSRVFYKRRLPPLTTIPAAALPRAGSSPVSPVPIPPTNSSPAPDASAPSAPPASPSTNNTPVEK